MLEVASERMPVRLAPIKNRTAEQVESLREKLGAQNLYHSSTMLGQKADIPKQEIEDYATAVWEEVRDLLEARDRKYYTAREEEAVREFLGERLPDTAQGLKQSLRDEATRIGRPSGITERLETELEATCHNSRVRVLSEAAKYFDSKRSTVRLVSWITSNPIVSHFVTAAIAALLTYLAGKLAKLF